jgi:hypothetical protein
MAEAATRQDSTANGTLCGDASSFSPNANERQQPDRTNNTISQPDVDTTHDQNFGQPRVDLTQLYEDIDSMFHPDLYVGHKTIAEEYIKTFKNFIGPELWDAYFGKMDQQDAHAWSFVDAQPGQDFKYRRFGQCLKHASSSSPSTIVVTNIAPEWIGVLGGLFKIDPRFFVDHFWWQYAPLPPDMCPEFLYKPPTPDMGASTGFREGSRQYLFDKVFSSQEEGLLPQGTWHRNVWIAPNAGEEDGWGRPTDTDSRRTVSDTLPGRSYQSIYFSEQSRPELAVFHSNFWKGRISYCKLEDSKRKFQCVQAACDCN